MYDAIIIGGGVGGYPAALKLSRAGKKVLLIEKSEIGGTCLNKGCIPTKAFLESAKLYSKIKNSNYYGITIENVKFSWEEILNYKNSVVKKLVKGVEFLLKKSKVEVLKGRAKVLSSSEVLVNEKKFEFKNLIVATGSKPTLPPPFYNVDGERIIFYDHVFSMKKLPSSILVVGGGVIGIEMATVFSSFGSSVTVVELMDEILPGMDDEMAKRLRKSLKNKGIKILTGAKVEEYDDKKEKIKVKITKKDNSIEELEVEKVLISTGRIANTDGIFSDSLEIKKDKKGFLEADENLKISENMFAVGDIVKGKLLAHRAMVQSERVSDLILKGEKFKIEEETIPTVLYTHPEYASCGITEKEAQESGFVYKTGRFPLSANGKAIIEGESTGAVKVIFVEEKLKGVHILSPHAGEMIGVFSKLIKEEASFKELKEVIFPHPTISESIGEAILNVEKEAIHILN